MSDTDKKAEALCDYIQSQVMPDGYEAAYLGAYSLNDDGYMVPEVECSPCLDEAEAKRRCVLYVQREYGPLTSAEVEIADRLFRTGNCDEASYKLWRQARERNAARTK